MLALLAFMGALGWGDVVVASMIAAASPAPAYNAKLFPPLLAAIMYYVAIIVVGSLALAAVNITRNRRQLSSLPPKYRIAYMFLARPVKARDILEGRVNWWYPLALCGKYKLSFNIYLNPEDVRREVARAISKGCLKPGDTVWVTYGVPAVPLLTISYVLALALGDTLLLKLLPVGPIATGR